MITVDTSVFISILKGEPDERKLAEILVASPRLSMSAGNYLECAMVALGRGLAGRSNLDTFVARYRIDVVPVDLPRAQLAADAFAQYGKGRHPAALNYGDCFAYALAKYLSAPLLFTGKDFRLTDIVPALPA
ncbi:type II toxin-antitoxin system VapC family toxin [uncultured Enterovirga sp.]|uniref:type II toxin-antitoxin system VapC family toxin n=1 Tax=uncultured Enterovirga sp. TaxID=2026352 RepID=UPI0035C9E943